jgi:hypothetical protein
MYKSYVYIVDPFDRNDNNHSAAPFPTLAGCDLQLQFLIKDPNEVHTRDLGEYWQVVVQRSES